MSVCYNLYVPKRCQYFYTVHMQTFLSHICLHIPAHPVRHVVLMACLLLGVAKSCPGPWFYTAGFSVWVVKMYFFFIYFFLACVCVISACMAPLDSVLTLGFSPTWWQCAWLLFTPAMRSLLTGESQAHELSSEHFTENVQFSHTHIF